jgi:hypothetical protein
MALRLLAHRRDPVPLDDELPGYNVALFDPRLERSFDTVLNRLREQDISRGALDMLVLRASHMDAREQIERDAPLASYLKGVPTLVLAGSYDSTAPEPRLHRPGWSGEAGPPLDGNHAEGARVRSDTPSVHGDLPPRRVPLRPAVGGARRRVRSAR